MARKAETVVIGDPAHPWDKVRRVVSVLGYQKRGLDQGRATYLGQVIKVARREGYQKWYQHTNGSDLERIARIQPDPAHYTRDHPTDHHSMWELGL